MGEVPHQGGAIAPPRVIAWNVARACAAACPACRLASGRGHVAAGELSTLECLHLVEDLLAAVPGARIVLSGGDPLEREDLETVVAQAVRRGAAVAVAALPARLGASRARTLARAGVSAIVVPLWSLHPAAGATPHGPAGPDVAQAALDAAQAAGIATALHVPAGVASADEVGALVDWAAARELAAVHVTCLDAQGAPDGARPLVDALASARLRHADAPRVAASCIPDALEPRCAHAARITADGKLTTCPGSSAVRSDLRREGFAAAWTSLAAARAACPRVLDEPAAPAAAPARRRGRSAG